MVAVVPKFPHSCPTVVPVAHRRAAWAEPGSEPAIDLGAHGLNTCRWPALSLVCAWLSTGQLFMDGKEYTEAGEAFETVVILPEQKHDAFARLGLATLLFYSAPADNPKANVSALQAHTNKPLRPASACFHSAFVSARRECARRSAKPGPDAAAARFDRRRRRRSGARGWPRQCAPTPTSCPATPASCLCRFQLFSKWDDAPCAMAASACAPDLVSGSWTSIASSTDGVEKRGVL